MSSTTTTNDKLTKKQKKAQQFRTRANITPEELAALKVKEEEEKKKKEIEEAEAAAAAVPKKRKTRRGKKGKGLAEQHGVSGPRFILFVGNLPYDITQQELMAHFKSSNPDRIRVRQDKGIAFLEFYNAHQDIKKKIDSALAHHHSVLKDRKINVELTAGGGGNSADRLTKIKEKNEKLGEERKRKMIEDEKASALKRSKNADGSNATKADLVNGVHPSRAGMIDQ